MEDFSSIDSLSENDMNISNEEDEKEMISILSEMEFNDSFEKYIINTINLILKENYKKITPLFEEKKYSLEEIIEEFKLNYPFILFKEKKNMNRSLDIQPKILNLITSDIKVENSTKINLSLDFKKEDNELSFGSLKLSTSLNKFLNDKKMNEQKNILSLTSKDENISIKQKPQEVKDFLKETEFKSQMQILLAKIIEYFEKEENNFKLLCNVEYKLDNIYTGITDMKFDFVINNMKNNNLFKEFVEYLEKNILIYKFKGKIYEIKNSNNFDEILSELKNVKNFDIFGEIEML